MNSWLDAWCPAVPASENAGKQVFDSTSGTELERKLSSERIPPFHLNRDENRAYWNGPWRG